MRDSSTVHRGGGTHQWAGVSARALAGSSAALPILEPVHRALSNCNLSTGCHLIRE